MRNKESELEKQFLEEWIALHPEARPLREFPFHPKRKYRFDFAWPTRKIAVEVQGMGPGHCSLAGMTQDHEKHLQAMLLGWRVVYLTTSHLKSKKKFHVIVKALESFLQLSSPPPRPAYTPINRVKTNKTS